VAVRFSKVNFGIGIAGRGTASLCVTTNIGIAALGVCIDVVVYGVNVVGVLRASYFVG
jgi:hypothetical protein